MSAALPPTQKRGPGQPSKLTPERKQKILAAVRCGASYKSACLAAGICEKTFQNWRRRASEPGSPAKYVRFLRELQSAEEEGQVARLATIQRASQRDWKAAAWLLERLDPTRWSVRYQIEHRFGETERFFRTMEELKQASAGPVEDPIERWLAEPPQEE